MRYYLLFLIFTLVNNLCHDGNDTPGLSKEDCFGRSISGEESKDTYFDEKVDHCCFVKSVYNGVEQLSCIAFPKSEIDDIVEYYEFSAEFVSKEVEYSIDCLAQIYKVNPLILLIMLILIYF